MIDTRNRKSTFSERLERLRQGDTSSDPWAGYERACLYALVAAGIESPEAAVTTFVQCTEATRRYSVALAHQLLMCIEDIRASDFDATHILYVFRCYSQARGYAGRLGFAGNVGALSDTMSAVARWLESRLAENR